MTGTHMLAAGLIASGFALAAGVLSTLASCASDEGCQLNGHCIAGRCICDAGWVGPDCGRLDLVEGPPPRRSGLLGDGSTADRGIRSSWGGSVVRDATDGTYSMFAAAMLDGCGIDQWGTNSEIVRAVADGPLGPYRLAETVVPRFAHEPNVVHAPDGSVVMFYYAANCSDGHCDPAKSCKSKPEWPWNMKQARPYERAGRRQRGLPRGLIRDRARNWMAHAPGPQGPWSAPQLLSPGPACAGGPTQAFVADLNFNAAIAPDGSMAGLWRCIETLPTTQPGATVLHSVAATDWRNVSTYKWSEHPAFATQGFGSEDPYVYIDSKGSFHAILHDEQGLPGHHFPNISRASAYGRHAWSRTGAIANWSISPWHGGSLAYNSTVRFNDGSSHSFTRRERPHLVLDENKTLVALSNGASPSNDELGSCFTLLQPIRSPDATHSNT